MSRSPLSASDLDLMAQASIASQMPVRFRSGTCWESLDGQCKGCGKDIEPRYFTGRVNRLVESVATVDAVGVCHACRLVTRFHYRLHEDMRVSGLTSDGWAAWQAKPSFIDRLRSLAVRFLHRSRP